MTKKGIRSIEKLEPSGMLWFLDYRMQYKSDLFIQTALRFVKKFGCSAFITSKENGEVITCRNYDFPHKNADGDVSGQNVVLKFHPKNGYESLCVADAAMLKRLRLPFFKGTPECGALGRLPYKLLPYLCMDGMNEKGLAASILVVDLKKGEEKTCQKEPGKKRMVITELLREVLDTCSTVKEAVSLAKNINMVCGMKIEAHLFLTDTLGDSMVLEWRYQKLWIIPTNAVTNFYVGSEDPGDCYLKGKLKEKYIPMPAYTHPYRCGYGHGYDRFRIIAEALERHLASAEPYRTVMTERDGFEVLKNVSQEFEHNDITSFTQYSIIYNNTKKTADLCVARNYAKTYSFSVQDGIAGIRSKE